MDSAYLQRIRFQLQKRVRRLNSCPYFLFHSSLIQFWNYIQTQPLINGILIKLESEANPYKSEISQLPNGEIKEFHTEAEQNAFTFRVIQYCALQPITNGLGPEVQIGHGLTNSSKIEDGLNQFREIFLEPFYEYIDEALDQQGAVLSLLLKYKKKVEWFEREQLSKVAEGDERTLAQHLYAFLFDQGLDFHIEPKSISGEADLVSPELVLDAKVFDGVRRGIKYISSGVHQVHTYARDFNQDVAYLLVFKICPETLHFEFAIEGQPVPYLTIGGKTIYLLMVDICDYEKSASKRGTLKTHSVDYEALVNEVKEEALPTS